MSPDLELALIHIPAAVRPAFEALFEVDAAMGDVVARASQPALAAVKLAWWRERLEELDEGKVPAEPRLRAAAGELLTRGISGARLSALEAGWAALLDPDVDAAQVAQRGALLFAIGAELLGSEADLADAGSLYALASAARRGLPDLFEPAKDYVRRLSGRRFPRKVRPLTMLTRAAARDLVRNEPEGSRARALAMLAHRWSGRIG